MTLSNLGNVIFGTYISNISSLNSVETSSNSCGLPDRLTFVVVCWLRFLLTDIDWRRLYTSTYHQAVKITAMILLRDAVLICGKWLLNMIELPSLTIHSRWFPSFRGSFEAFAGDKPVPHYGRRRPFDDGHVFHLCPQRRKSRRLPPYEI